jgi:uncharacterized protein (TIGR00730 family)
MSNYMKSVCVFCGARFGEHPAFREAANEFGTALANNQWRLVYGAGDVGLMGEVAQATQAGGGATFGVIPVHLFEREVGKRDLSTFVITENMHERKKVMFMNSDAIVVLPGGAGSLDEFFEVLTWRQLGLHDKPIILLNVEGYWDPLKTLLDQVVSNGFADASIMDFVEIADSSAAAISKLKTAFS